MAQQARKHAAGAHEPHGRDDSGLVYTDPTALTILRRRRGKAWSYYREDGGEPITDPTEIERLNRIALPPAYTDARFSVDPNGHLQAIGIDARGRRQYRYHPAFREAQESRKFANCAAFGLALPRLRQQLERDLKADPRSRPAVLAAVVRILDCAYLRIGNRAYARDNKSFGLTTLRNRHARLTRGALALKYRGKSGIIREVKLTDRTVMRIVRQCQDLPGQQLFQFQGEDGQPHAVSSGDVNAYLRAITGSDFSAKDFRTWHGSVIAFAALNRGAGLKEMLADVSAALANTPAVARRAYIHPSLVEAARVNSFARRRLPRAGRLSREERGFLEWLQQAEELAQPAAS